MSAEKRGDTHVVIVAMTVPIADPDEASEFVRAALATLDGWQSEEPTTLPRYQIAAVRAEERRIGEWPIKRPTD